MKCPKCQSGDFRPIKTEDGTEVDFCSGCKGIWFENGELSFYLETSSDLPSKRATLPEAKVTQHSCPACSGEKLLEMPYSKSDNLMLDYCKGCHGVWLDSKEIIKVEELARKVETVGKVSNTIKSLEKMGFKVLGGKVS